MCLRRKPWIVLAVTLVVTSLAHAYPRPESDCTAEIEVTLDRQEQQDDGSVKLTFTVEVSSAEDCAEVTYDLVVEEWMTNDQTHKIRIPGELRVGGGPVTEIVEHRLLPRYKFLGHEARIALCRTCSVDP